MLTTPFVLYGIFRYQLLGDPQEIERKNPELEQGGKTERPEEILIRDKPLLLTVLGWIITVFTILLFDKLQWIH
jgi:decaprenyl-phosphate phosphoribosyltransferase